MASLKDMRNRIASVKATRKITKAMQMVAAAKLRRAQEAAQAARPYAERMDRMLASIGTRVTVREGVSPLLVGTGKDQVHFSSIVEESCQLSSTYLAYPFLRESGFFCSLEDSCCLNT